MTVFRKIGKMRYPHKIQIIQPLNIDKPDIKNTLVAKCQKEMHKIFDTLLPQSTRIAFHSTS